MMDKVSEFEVMNFKAIFGVFEIVLHMMIEYLSTVND